MHQLNQFDEPNVCGMCKINDPTKMIDWSWIFALNLTNLRWHLSSWYSSFLPYWPYWRVVNGCVSKFAKWGHNHQEEPHILELPALNNSACLVLYGPLFKESPSSGSVVYSCSSWVQWSKIIGCLLVGGWQKPISNLYTPKFQKQPCSTDFFLSETFDLYV